MMRFVVLILLLLGAQFSATVFAPAAGKPWLLWPFGEGSTSWIGLVGGLKPSASPLTIVLAGVATICFLAAALALFGLLVPADLFRPLVLAAVVSSLLLHVLFLGLWAIAPIVVAAVLLWGVQLQNWSVSLLAS